MRSIVHLYSNKYSEINRFLEKFYCKSNKIIEDYSKVSNSSDESSGYHTKINDKEWKKEYNNPIDIIDIMSALIDNNETYDISMWISLDEGLFIYVNNDNLDDIIKYLYERFPY